LLVVLIFSFIFRVRVPKGDRRGSIVIVGINVPIFHVLANVGTIAVGSGDGAQLGLQGLENSKSHKKKAPEEIGA
jgi:hypothetical protein